MSQTLQNATAIRAGNITENIPKYDVMRCTKELFDGNFVGLKFKF